LTGFWRVRHEVPNSQAFQHGNAKSIDDPFILN
jgi:protein ImuA